MSFVYFRANNVMIAMTEVGFDVGEAGSRLRGRFLADTAFYPTGQHGGGPNRAPGYVKPAWKWSTEKANSSISELRKFLQALSQLNLYLKRYRTRHGYLLTTRELVAVKRLDNQGNLLLSEPVRWETHGTPSQPRLALLLA